MHIRSQDIPQDAKKKSIAYSTTQRLELANKNLKDMVDQLAIKLTPVLDPSGPGIINKEEQIQQAYPPLFNDIRSNTEQIEESLEYLADIIHKIEL